MSRRLPHCFSSIALLIIVGCHSGRQIQNPEYAPYCGLARTSANCDVSTGDAGIAELPPESTSALPEQPSLIIEVDPLPAASELTTGSTLPQLIALALERNAEIGGARQAVEMARARLPQAASLDDPMVDVVGWPIYPNVPQTASGRMTIDLAVSQKVPWLGKRSARVGAGARELNAAEARLAAAELRVVEEVKLAYATLWGAERSVLLVAADVQLLRELATIVEAMYETGKVGQQDLLRLNSEIGRAETEVIRSQAERSQAAAELNRVLQLPPQSPVPIDPQLPDPAEFQQLDALLAQALAARPELQAAWAAVQRDQWRVEQARLEYYPDLTFKVGWGDMTTDRALSPIADGIDNLTTGVNFNVPIRHARLEGAVREAESQVVVGVRELERLRAETLRDVQQRHAAWQSQLEQLRTYREVVVPRMQQALELTTRAYQVDEADFSDVIDVRRELLALRLTELQLQVDQQKSQAALERLLADLP